MSNNYITIRSFYDPVEADLAKGLLESEGVPALLLDGHINRLDPLITPATHGIRLQVPEEAKGRAEEILQAIQASNTVDDENPAQPGFSTAEGDAWMRRAAVAAVVGTITFIFPFNLYAIWLIAVHPEARSPKGSRMMWVAIVFTLVALAGWGTLLAPMFAGSPREQPVDAQYF